MMKHVTLIFAMLSAFTLSFAQETPKATPDAKAANAAAQANNPLANMTALNFHNYYIPHLTNAPKEAYLNNSWIRFAKPFSKGKLLLRVSAPISTIGTPDPVTGIVTTTNGLGDINAFMSYNFISKPTATVGIGPLLVAPTASSEALGVDAWQGGLAFVAFISKSPIFQFGGLVTWQTAMGGNQDANLGALQPFYFFQLGKGTYLRGAPIWLFDFENENYHIPIALGIGKIVKVNNTVFNLFVEPQYAVLHQGTQPQVQIFTGINLQFLNKQKPK
jgi:hypothetical protein